jgi:hypothetical protein
VNEQRALELSSRWWAAQAQIGGKPLGLRDFLARELRDTLPEPDGFGVVAVEGDPHLLALAGEVLILASASIEPDGTPVAVIRLLALRPWPGFLIRSTRSADGRSLRRTWRIEPAGGEPAVVETEEILEPMFPSDQRPDSAELLLREALALAAAGRRDRAG